ncbi:hypothetical protein ERJ75_000564300 [Trypanosoma vivax]|nr:hypothetical protein ERJ75_000564300 [Trypanosoma vivax]
MAALPMLVAPRQQYLLGPATWSLPDAASPWRAMHGAALSLFNRFAHTQLRTRVEVGASLAVDQSQVDANVARGCAPCASRLFRTAGGVVASRLPSAGAVGVGHGRARGARPRVSTVAAGHGHRRAEGLPQGEARVRDVGLARRSWHERPGLSGSVASLEGDGGG